MLTYTTHAYQFRSSPWAGALDRYKGFSADVQCRLEQTNERTNKQTNGPFETE